MSVGLGLRYGPVATCRQKKATHRSFDCKIFSSVDCGPDSNEILGSRFSTRGLQRHDFESIDEFIRSEFISVGSEGKGGIRAVDF